MMKAKILSSFLAVCLFLPGNLTSSFAEAARHLLLEVESFQQPGGWVVDQQFMDVMGSPYLLAHGLGKPCADANTRVQFPAPGTYHVWVRTKDWVPEPQWAPGQFRVIINGKELGETFGTKGDGAWIWQDGGTVEIGKRPVRVALHDLTGFEGRCDAIYFSADANDRPPAKAGEAMTRWREELLRLAQPPAKAGEFDVVLVGGGLSGCAAAISAARLGCKVAMVQNRPVLGGNNSPEIGVHTGGWGIEGKIIGPEISGDYGHNPNDPKWWNPKTSPMAFAARKRQLVVNGEKNITQFLGWHVFRAQKKGNAIQSLDAQNIYTGKQLRFVAPVFIDCTGDGWVGYYAGADFRQGQEGRAEHNESLAPEQPVKMTLGTSVLWYAANDQHTSTFPEVPWGEVVSGGLAATSGNWTWEYGHYRDTIWEAEEIRDHLFRAIYGAFITAKKANPDTFARLAIQRINYIAGKRESRRLMGDYIMTQADCWDNLSKPDKVVQGGNPFDLHVPGTKHDFLIHIDPRVTLKERKLFDIPYRSLYSRNVANLLMAGRCASCTRVAHAAMRLENTGAQEGVAVGAAAYLCHKYATTPRGIYEKHLKELQDIVFGRGEYAAALKPRVAPYMISQDGKP